MRRAHRPSTAACAVPNAACDVRSGPTRPCCRSRRSPSAASAIGSDGCRCDSHPVRPSGNRQPGRSSCRAVTGRQTPPARRRDDEGYRTTVTQNGFPPRGCPLDRSGERVDARRIRGHPARAPVDARHHLPARISWPSARHTRRHDHVGRVDRRVDRCDSRRPHRQRPVGDRYRGAHRRRCGR